MEGRIIFLDLEASGLHRTSYPIEVGWSLESEKIHDISRAECVRNGIDVRDAAQRLNEAFSGAQFYCDSPGFDGDWLRKLFAASGIEPTFDLQLRDALTPIRTALARRGEDHRMVAQRLQAVCPAASCGG